MAYSENIAEVVLAVAARILKRLPELGISLDAVARQLEEEGVTKFKQPFDKLLKTLAPRAQRQTAGSTKSSASVKPEATERSQQR